MSLKVSNKNRKKKVKYDTILNPVQSNVTFDFSEKPKYPPLLSFQVILPLIGFLFVLSLFFV